VYCYCDKRLALCCFFFTNLNDHLMRTHPLKYTPEGEKNKAISSRPIDTFVRKTVCSEGHAKFDAYQNTIYYQNISPRPGHTP